MSSIKVSVDGSPAEVESGADGFKLFTERAIVAMRVNGELRDLAHKVQSGDVIERVEISSPDGLNILRHSAAHVLAQAVQNINPDAKLGIGPPIKDGFYYDFDVENSFTPEDLKALEKAMERIIRSGQRFIRRVTTDGDARVELIGRGLHAGVLRVQRVELGLGFVQLAAPLRNRRLHVIDLAEEDQRVEVSACEFGM